MFLIDWLTVRFTQIGIPRRKRTLLKLMLDVTFVSLLFIPLDFARRRKMAGSVNYVQKILTIGHFV